MQADPHDIALLRHVFDAWYSHADPDSATYNNAMALKRILDLVSSERREMNTPGGLNRDVSAGTSHSEPDGSATKPAISRSEDGASQGAAPIPLPADANGKRPRLFYFEETENCWCPADGLEVENIIGADNFLNDGDITEIQFKREDMTDAEFDAIPEG